MYLGDIYTISVNLAGLPGISVPCGSSTGTADRSATDRSFFRREEVDPGAYTYEQARGKFGREDA